MTTGGRARTVARLSSLFGEAVGVTGAVAFDQACGACLPQVLVQLLKTIALVAKAESRDDDLLELPGGPASDGGACMQQLEADMRDQHGPIAAGAPQERSRIELRTG